MVCSKCPGKRRGYITQANTKTNEYVDCSAHQDFSRDVWIGASLPGRSEIWVELQHQLSWRKHWTVEESLKASLVLAQWVARQPQLPVDEVEGKKSLLNLLSIVRRPGDHVEEVVIAHNDSLSLNGIPDNEVVLVAVVALEAGLSRGSEN